MTTKKKEGKLTTKHQKSQRMMQVKNLMQTKGKRRQKKTISEKIPDSAEASLSVSMAENPLKA